MPLIDINVDIAEGAPWDRALLAWATRANICCGIHAGSPELATHTVSLCRKLGVTVGAHPGYHDRPNIGRQSRIGLPNGEQAAQLHDQLSQFIERNAPEYIKPHGALYHDLMSDDPSIEPLIHAIFEWNLPLVGFPGSRHETLCDLHSVPFISEGFAERGYDSNGHLKPRSQSGALLTQREPIQKQVRQLMTEVQTICVHGDSPHCLTIIEWVHEALTKEVVSATS